MNHLPPTLKKIIGLQRRIYHSLENEVQDLLGEIPESIKPYERENWQDFRAFRKKLIQTTREELIESVKTADVTFVGDYHTFDQAQRSALRLLRDCYTESEKWFLGLELVPSHFQREVDGFQNGKFTTRKFLEKISYHEEWGFPWKNYAPLFDWAKENRVRIIALNRPNQIFQPKEEKELHLRDQWAAGIITDLFHKESQEKIRPKMLVLYGELHIGSRHLPKQLSRVSGLYLPKPLRWNSVHQNVDKVYWDTLQKKGQIQAETFRVSKKIYCLLSSPPWTKLQSLIQWAEGELHQNLEDLDDYIPEESIADDLSTLRQYGKSLAGLLGTEVPSYESLHLYSVNDIERLQTTIKHPALRSYIKSNRKFFDPNSMTLYVGSSSHNRLSELAALHLMKTVNHCKDVAIKKPSDFYRTLMEVTFSYFGSLIFNPRRKCDSLEDHRVKIQQLRSLKKTRTQKQGQLEISHRQFVIDFLDTSSSQNKKQQWINELLKHPLIGREISARFVGKLIGKALFTQFIKNQVSTPEIHRTFFAPVSDSDEWRTRFNDFLKTLTFAE